MSERGVFAVDRGIFDHQMFAPEPYTEREAWLWMLSAAVWKDARVRAGRVMVDLKRGQLCFSERFLATKWQWPKTTVRRFLTRLKSEAMIGALADHDHTIITICNYERYAFDGGERGPKTGPQNGPQTDRSRTKEEEPKKVISKKEDIRAVAKATRPNADFDEFWEARPGRKGADPRDPARKLYDAAVKGGVDPADLLAALKRYAKIEADHVGTPYLPQMVKWLRDKRWNDYPVIVPFAPAAVDWEQIVGMYAKVGHWSKWAGPEPGAVGCRCPPEILERHGIVCNSQMAAALSAHLKSGFGPGSI